MTRNILHEIHQTLVSRLTAYENRDTKAEAGVDADSSYVMSLYEKGLDAILKKIGEEATETVMAAKDGSPDRIIYEVADLWFHTMVLLARQGLQPQQVLDELARRMGTSGLQEKASRGLQEKASRGLQEKASRGLQEKASQSSK